MKPLPKTKQIAKAPKKYVPNQSQAKIIVSYFVHNNFQDFNTWQQISRSKCEFQYNQLKGQKHECKATLKFDDPKIPIIMQNAICRTKKNSKKKVLYKIIHHLLYMGLIGHGFKQPDFIKKLPRRRKQSSEEEQIFEGEQFEKQNINLAAQLQRQHQIQEQISMYCKRGQIQQALNLINLKNFDKLWHYAIRTFNCQLCVRILRKLQMIEKIQQMDEEIKDYQASFTQPWQEYCEKQFKDPSKEDLTDFLPYYLLQLPSLSPSNQQKPKKQIHSEIKVCQLPCQILRQSLPLPKQGNNLFQFFYPIENTFNYLRNPNIRRTQRKSIFQSTEDYLMEIQDKIVLPKFDSKDRFEPMPYSVIERLYQAILAHSYDQNIVRCLLNIMNNQVKQCVIPICQPLKDPKIDPVAYYLSQKQLLAAEFSYSLSKKLKETALLTIQGFLICSINNQVPFYSSQSLERQLNPKYIYTLQSKQPEEVLQKKLPQKKSIPNTNQFEQMPQFMTQEYILISSKTDPNNQFYIGCIEQTFPSLKIRLIDCMNYYQINEKYPCTIYKLQNSKMYTKLSKSLTHVLKNSMNVLLQKTYILIQPPTFPIIRVIAQLLSQIVCHKQVSFKGYASLSNVALQSEQQQSYGSKNQTVLIVTEFLEELSASLGEMGFRVIKVSKKLKLDDKIFAKSSLICVVTPQTICADSLKNYTFTRVIVEGAHRVSEAMIMMALDKGCEQLYLVGDPKNIRIINKQPHLDIMGRLLPIIDPTHIITYQSIFELQVFHPQIVDTIQQFFYLPKNQLSNFKYKLNRGACIESPQIKGFPWPNWSNRIAFINQADSEYFCNIQAELCVHILSSVINSGFITYKEIGCRVLTENMKYILHRKITQKKRQGTLKSNNTNPNLLKSLRAVNINNSSITNNNGSIYLPHTFNLQISSQNAQNHKNTQKDTEIDKLVQILSGSRFRQKQLCIMLLGNKTGQNWPASIFNAALQESRRGLIIIGNLSILPQSDYKWMQILQWANKQKIVMNYQP